MLNYGDEYKNVETMKATFQKVPEHLQKPVRPEDHTNLLWHLFWDLDTERRYYSTGLSQKLPVSKIREEIARLGFAGYEAEIVKDIIMRMDKEYRDWDYARYRQNQQRLGKGNAQFQEE